eukprot:TRINITY_DN16902_c0_g1_i1.p1 TRINITY_DN16902_c0_g1~~TRINITY_DN16902_c0_g1_i1.p1  ORF type:complete len:195 (-),score=52.99 TRINITY_DN16902_c0_g1_i1:106-690(-)
MTISSKLRMEDVKLADAIVDFANKQPSLGEVIPSATQEELLFSIKPEAMLSMVLYEELEPTEVGIVHGAQRYCNYTGYMDTFRFHSPFPPLEDGGGGGTPPAAMIVMDAMVNRGKAEVKDEGFERDFMKAYLGFSSIQCIPRRYNGAVVAPSGEVVVQEAGGADQAAGCDAANVVATPLVVTCLLYTSPSPRDS